MKKRHIIEILLIIILGWLISFMPLRYILLIFAILGVFCLGG